jgi:multidrug efflux pump subunit AcrA (membrane-fusion protein)
LPLTAVNPRALTTRDGATVVYVIRENKAVEVAVTPGRKLGELTAFAGDAKSGDTAVLDPRAELKAGVLLEPAKK